MGCNQFTLTARDGGCVIAAAEQLLVGADNLATPVAGNLATPVAGNLATLVAGNLASSRFLPNLEK